MFGKWLGFAQHERFETKQGFSARLRPEIDHRNRFSVGPANFLCQSLKKMPELDDAGVPRCTFGDYQFFRTEAKA
jgi:hypothetical protein